MKDTKKIKVLKMIAEDMKKDAENFDGKPFDGKTVAEYFGNQGAAIAALANILKSTLEQTKTDSMDNDEKIAEIAVDAFMEFITLTKRECITGGSIDYLKGMIVNSLVRSRAENNKTLSICTCDNTENISINRDGICTECGGLRAPAGDKQ